MSNLGIGAMLYRLKGGTDNSVEKYIGKTIQELIFNEAKDRLEFLFTDGIKIAIYDDGQSCCEHRYMVVEDDLSYYNGSQFLNASIQDGGEVKAEDDWGESHDIEFLHIETSKGTFTVANHNEHNGYYGGFGMNIIELNGGN